MKLFKNQKGTSDVVIISIILGIIGAIFITGVFVWQEINKSKKVGIIENIKTIKEVLEVDYESMNEDEANEFSKFIHLASLDLDVIGEDENDLERLEGSYQIISEEDKNNGRLEHYIRSVRNKNTSESFEVNFRLFNSVGEAQKHWDSYKKDLKSSALLRGDNMPVMSELEDIEDDHIYFLLQKDSRKDLLTFKDIPALKVGHLAVLHSNAVFEVALELNIDTDEEAIKDIFYDWHESLNDYQIKLEEYVSELVDLEDYCEFIELENRWDCFLYNLDEVESMSDEDKKRNGEIYSDIVMSCHNLGDQATIGYGETADGTYNLWCSLKYDDGLSACTRSTDCQGICTVYRKSDNQLFIPQITYRDWFNMMGARYDFSTNTNYYEDAGYKFACSEFYFSPCDLVLKIEGDSVTLVEDCHYEVKTSNN